MGTPGRLLPAFIFLFAALPVLLFVALNVPTGESPDEVAHVVRMESLLHGQAIGHRLWMTDPAGVTTEYGGVQADAAMMFGAFAFPPGTPLAQRIRTRGREEALVNYPWERRASFMSIPNTAAYPPFLYLPGAMGLAAARLAGWGPWMAMHWARLATAAAYLALGGAALLAARRQQGALLALLLLPMSLWMAGTCTQDGVLIPLSVLAAALLTRETLRAWWGAVLCLALVLMARPTYLPLALAAMALAPVQGWRPMLRAAGGLCAVIPAIAWFALATSVAAVPFFLPAPTPGGPLWDGDPARIFTLTDPAVQLSVLLKHPSLLVRLPWRMLHDQGAWLVNEAIGVLGTLDVIMPESLYRLWTVALAAVLAGDCLRRGRAEQGTPGWGRVLVLASVALTVVATCVGQYVSWTPPGAATAAGIQGRYAIPLLAFVAIGLPSFGAGRLWLLQPVLRAPVVVAGLAGMVIIPGLVVATYWAG